MYVADAITEGKITGRNEAKLEAAENLLKEGDSPEKVARCIGLPLEEVIKLLDKI